MNNSAEAEKFLISDDHIHEHELEDYLWVAYAMEAYHQHMKEKELSELNDEVIEGIVYSHCNGTWREPNGVEVADEVDVRAVAKAIRDHLKQKK